MNLSAYTVLYCPHGLHQRHRAQYTAHRAEGCPHWRCLPRKGERVCVQAGSVVIPCFQILYTLFVGSIVSQRAASIYATRCIYRSSKPEIYMQRGISFGRFLSAFEGAVYLYCAQSTFFMSPLLASSACIASAARRAWGVCDLPSVSFR